MSDALADIFNNFNPDLPATEEFYYDCSRARGNGALTHEFQRCLARAKTKLTFLFSGHLGCGKSSELRRLAAALEKAESPDACCLPIFVDASEYLDDFDVTPTDILLAIVTELAATFRDKLNIELHASFFARRLDELKKYLLSDVEINEGEIPLLGAKLKIQRLKKDPDARDHVRKALEPRMATMLEEINATIGEAREKMKQSSGRYQDVVFIVDNLEKIRRVPGTNEGEPSLRELFIARYAQLTGMEAHFIYTVPLRLIRSSDRNVLRNLYSQILVLPMVKVLDRSGQPNREGHASLRALVEKRLGDSGAGGVGGVFEDDAFDLLVTYSGGVTRELMRFVQRASTYMDALPITVDAAYRAIGETVETFSTSIPEAHWRKLAALDLSPDRQIDNADDDYMKMLENLSVLEYRDSETNPKALSPTDRLAHSEPWYAVNPVVKELQRFKSATESMLDDRRKEIGLK